MSDSDELLISPTQLLERLQELLGAENLADLRGALTALRQDLGDPAHVLYQVGDDEETLAIPQAYLDGELAQVGEALTLERAHYYLERLARSAQGERKGAINDIDLNRWKAPEYEDILTDSLWRFERRDSSGAHRADYWGNFIPQIPNQLMRRYTRAGDWVIDTFAGSGTSLIEGRRLGRNTIGVEIQARMVERTRALIAEEPNRADVVCAVHEGDSTATDYRALLAGYGREQAQLVLMHPPYFDIIRFSDDPRDLSNAASVEQFLAQMSALAERVAPVLQRGRYLALVIGDKYVKGEWIPLGFQTMQAILPHGFTLKSIVVKNFEETMGKRSQKELWRYRALVGGFYIFKHEYIFLLRKR